MLADSAIQDLILIVDPTLQEDRVVKVSLNVWYRGRALPLVWSIWPANQPLEGEGFWQRIDELLRRADALLPPGVRVVPSWRIGPLAPRPLPIWWPSGAGIGWCGCRARPITRIWDGLDEHAIAQLVTQRGQRRKLRGVVFRKPGGGTRVWWSTGAHPTKRRCA